MKRKAQQLMVLVVLTSTSLMLASCGGPPDDAEATRVFTECLSRNGIEAERVEVTMGSEGHVEEISLAITSEGSVAYDPTVRLICTEEVEASR